MWNCASALLCPVWNGLKALAILSAAHCHLCSKKGPVHTGCVSRFACKFACKPFDVAAMCPTACEVPSTRCSASCVNRAASHKMGCTAAMWQCKCAQCGQGLSLIHTACAMRHKGNGTCVYEWECSHCMQATSKEKCSNLHASHIKDVCVDSVCTHMGVGVKPA